MKEHNEPMKDIETMVRKAGYRVMIHTKFCETWQSKHADCHGCESQEGCKRVAGLGSVMLTGMMCAKKITGFEETLRHSEAVAREMERVLSLDYEPFKSPEDNIGKLSLWARIKKGVHDAFTRKGVKGA